MRKSFIEAVASLKNAIDQDGDKTFEHILLGLEVDENGNPSVILNSVQTGGYIGLGIINAMQIMLDKAKEEIESGFKNILDEQHEQHTQRKPKLSDINKTPNPDMEFDAASDAVENFTKGLTNNEDVKAILDKYKPRIIKALLNRDDDEMELLKKEITSELRKLKGDDFNPEFLFGIEDDSIDLRKSKNNGFDPKNTKKYF